MLFDTLFISPMLPKVLNSISIIQFQNTLGRR